MKSMIKLAKSSELQLFKTTVVSVYKYTFDFDLEPGLQLHSATYLWEQEAAKQTNMLPKRVFQTSRQKL